MEDVKKIDLDEKVDEKKISVQKQKGNIEIELNEDSTELVVKRKRYDPETGSVLPDRAVERHSKSFLLANKAQLKKDLALVNELLAEFPEE